MNIDTGIPEESRRDIARKLSCLLADSCVLSLKTRNYHWNVTGPQFHALHLMFDGQYKELAQAADVIAERIRALGRPAPGSFSQFAALSSIKESGGSTGRGSSDSESRPPSADIMIKNLLKDHEAVSKTARAAFPAAQKGNDEASLDILTQRIRAHEKTAWILRSLLEK